MGRLYDFFATVLGKQMIKTLTPRMKQIAKAHGLVEAPPAAAVQAFRKLLADVITRQRSMTGAAEVLGLPPAQLSHWCKWLDIQRTVKRTTTARTVAKAV